MMIDAFRVIDDEIDHAVYCPIWESIAYYISKDVTDQIRFKIPFTDHVMLRTLIESQLQGLGVVPLPNR